MLELRATQVADPRLILHKKAIEVNDVERWLQPFWIILSRFVYLYKNSEQLR